MSEMLPYEDSSTGWRVVVILGSVGLHGELDAAAMQSLPLEAAFQDGVLGANDTVQVEPLGDTDGQYIDWRIDRPDGADALMHAVASTLQLSRLLGLKGVELKAARMGNLDDTTDIDTGAVWYEMPDYTEQAHELERDLQLPATITADDFR